MRSNAHGKLLIDMNEAPIRKKLTINKNQNWSELYPDAKKKFQKMS